MGYYIGSSTQAKETSMLLEAGYVTKTPGILWGPPGIGKTDFVRALARKHNLNLFILIASTMDPADINGLPAIKEIIIERPDGTKESITVTEPTLQYWAEALIREGRGILFFDEANSAVPAVQATLLSVLQGRIVGRHVLPDDVWMIAASNEVADGADSWELSPPMANRFLHITFTPVLQDWYEGMICNWGEEPKDDADAARLKKLQYSRAEVAGFVKQNPTLLHDMPKTSAGTGKAWASPRSWDAAARILSIIPKTPQTKGVRYKAVEGLVGKAVAVLYEKYEDGLRLPQYEDIIRNPDAVNWKSLSASETRLILDIVLANVSLETIEPTVALLSSEGLQHKADILAAITPMAIKQFGPFLKDPATRTVFARFLTSGNKLKLIADAGILEAENK